MQISAHCARIGDSSGERAARRRAAVTGHRTFVMALFIELFSSPSGLLSAGVIAFIIGMAFWLGAFFNRKIAEEAKQNKR